MDEFGPIQLVMIGFDTLDRFKGEITRELDAVRSRQVIRLIDALAVTKTAAGNLIVIEDSDFTDDERAQIGVAIRRLLGMDRSNGAGSAESDKTTQRGIGLTTGDVRRVAEALEPGTGALFLLFEHTWATGLKQAVRNAGGVPIVQGFLTPEAVLMMGAELQAIMEAEATIELAEALKGAALLDAVITMEETLRVTDEVVEAANAIRAQAAAETVRTLIVADLLEDAAAQEATEALVAAGLIEKAALAEAEQAARAAQSEMQMATADAEAGG